MKMVQRTLALASLCVMFLGLSGPGCQQECEPNTIVLDNRARQLSTEDGDWICTGVPIRPDPPAEPDISGTWPLDVGPKDPDAVVKMAILIQSCLPSIQVVTPRLNWTISTTYFDYLRDAVRQAMFSRSGCFKDKFNGCDAVRECYGIVQENINLAGRDSEPPKPLPTPGCVDGIRRRSWTYRDPVEDTVNFNSAWVNCKGLGLECYDEYQLYSWCTSARTPCEPEETVSSCMDGRTYRCFDDRAKNHANYYYEKPHCWEFGLSCEEQNDYPWWKPNEEWSDCTGTGAACVQDTIGEWVGDDAIYSYIGGGIVCESDTVLRACVGKGEKQIDCVQLGKGFKCISEGVPHCGFAAECNRDTPVTCDGDSLVVCDAGRIRKVDCKTLGFTTCDEEHSACGPNSLF